MSEPGPQSFSADRLIALASLFKTQGKQIECRVEGGSMSPTLPASCLVRVDCGARGSYGVGDVVAFIAGRNVVSHRIVHEGRRGRAREYLITLGDDRILPDPPVHEASVLGRVGAVQSGAGWAPLALPSRRSGLRRLAVRPLLGLAKAALEFNVPLAQELALKLQALRASLLARPRAPQKSQTL